MQSFLSSSGAAFAKAPSSCKPTKLYEGRDKSNIALLVQYDTNCDGRADYSFVSPDDPSKPLSAHIDTNFDGRTDISVEDRNRDGKWDISFHDVDYDGKIDLIGYHTDGKLTPTRFRKVCAWLKILGRVSEIAVLHIPHSSRQVPAASSAAIVWRDLRAALVAAG